MCLHHQRTIHRNPINTPVISFVSALVSNKLRFKILIWSSCCEGGQWPRQQPSWRYLPLMCDKNVKFKHSERGELIRKLRHLKWNCGIDIYDKANLLSSVLTEGDFYEEARKWGCQLNPTSITKTSLEKPFFVRNIIHFKLKRALTTPKTSLSDALTRFH